MKTPYSDCPIETFINLTGGKWKILILWRLAEKTRRYGELKRLMPKITERVFVRTLKSLEEDGLIYRIDYNENPPRVEYALTPLGQSLEPLLDAMCSWGLTINAEQSLVS